MGLSMGVDIGAGSMKWVLLGPDGDVADRGTAPTPRGGPDTVVDAVVALTPQRAARVGVALPGHVDRASGRALFMPNLAGDWAGFPFTRRLGERTAATATVVNDALAFGLAELRLGAGSGDTVFAVLGTGVGGAVAVSGHILTGSRDNLGQIGHLTVDPAGPPCPCGNRGCLEAYAGAAALVAGYTRAAGGVAWFANGEPTAREVAAAAEAGDPTAAKVFRDAGRALGIALGDALAVFAASAAVIGGGVAAALPLLLPGIEAELAKRRALLGHCTVRPSRIGPHSGAIGAALWTQEGRS